MLTEARNCQCYNTRIKGRETITFKNHQLSYTWFYGFRWWKVGFKEVPGNLEITRYSVLERSGAVNTNRVYNRQWGQISRLVGNIFGVNSVRSSGRNFQYGFGCGLLLEHEAGKIMLYLWITFQNTYKESL